MVKRQTKTQQVSSSDFSAFLKNRIENFPEVVDMNEQGASTPGTISIRRPERNRCDT
jgi:hypothetical protein